MLRAGQAVGTGMNFRRWVNPATAFILIGSLPVLVLWPAPIDLAISTWFFDPALDRFPARGQAFPEAAHAAISLIGKVLAALFAAGLIGCLLTRRALVRLDARAYGFLLCCMLMGPLVISNGLFKNHWGRARPMQLIEFGGTHEFTPPLLIADQCQRNCSFVAGDPSVGFMLHCLAYLPSARRRRQWLFWAGMVAGAAAGALRIWMGAHFFSDVIFAAVFMLLVAALVHAVFHGWRSTRVWWLDWWRGPGDRSAIACNG